MVLKDHRVRILFLMLGFLPMLFYCKKSSSEKSDLQFFTENGVSWGFGKVFLEPNTDPLNFYIKNLNPELPLGDAKGLFEFFVNSNKPEFVGRKWDILYADRVYVSTTSESVSSPGSNRGNPVTSITLMPEFVSMVFDYRVILRQGSSDVIDIYLILKKAGMALEGRKEILLGSAKFDTNNPIATIQLQNNFLTSKIVEGYRSGSYILHITPNDKIASDASLKEKCKISSLVVGQVRGAPISNCVWINPAEDVCDGSPASDNCRPPSPMNISAYKLGEYKIIGAEKLDQNTYALGLDETAEVVFNFDKAVTQISEAESFCEKDFLALARTIGDRVNPVCTFQILAAAISQTQKLQCRVKVKFDKPMNYAEKVCNVYGTHVTLKQSSVVQLVYK